MRRPRRGEPAADPLPAIDWRLKSRPRSTSAAMRSLPGAADRGGVPRPRRALRRRGGVPQPRRHGSGTLSAAANTSTSAIRCRPVVEQLRQALYPHLAPIANRWRERLREEARFPPTLDAYLDALPRRRPDAADAAAPQIRGRRLQLPAPGSLRRAGVSAAGDGAAERAGAGFRRRRVPAGRAAAAHAVEGRGRAARAGRRGDLRGQPPAGRRHARRLPRRRCATASAGCAPASASRSASSSTTLRKPLYPAPTYVRGRSRCQELLQSSTAIRRSWVVPRSLSARVSRYAT